MNEKDIQNMINETYSQDREDTLRGMLRDFYNRQNTSSILVAWGYAVVVIAVAVFCGIRFFKVDDHRMQLMYAVVFLVMMQFMQLIKIFAWQLIHRNGLKREIKRLEIRIAQLAETVAKQES